ncbi:unnamed protein product [Caenorhabditis angaria]|uniref:SEA domain-containing protein n=1 Tax=Caenorhabditis angaria TaxID=860376 RepID=A0A9P1MZD6_9PELO|nr:unnamed protein product [Caenorhabditis angaria]
MERVHIASFVVGITGLIIGIVGIVLAIVFGTASPNCPICPESATNQCNSKLFSLQTSLTKESCPWNDNLRIPNSKEFNETSQKVAQQLQNSIQSGLNQQSSTTRFKSFAVSPTQNAVTVQITEFRQDNNGLTQAIGSGVVSSAKPINQVPDQTQVETQIQNDKTTVNGTVNTSSVVCKTESNPDCDCSTTAAFVSSTQAMSTNNPQTTVVTSAQSSFGTSTTTSRPTSRPIITSTAAKATTQTTAVPSTSIPSTGAPSTLSPSTTAQQTTNAPSTAQTTTNAASTVQPSTNAPSTAQPSTNVPSTSQPSSNAPSTAQQTTNIPSTVLQTTTTQSSTVRSTTTGTIAQSTLISTSPSSTVSSSTSPGVSSTNIPSTQFSSTGVTSTPSTKTNSPSTSIPSTLASSTVPSLPSSSNAPSTAQQTTNIQSTVQSTNAPTTGTIAPSTLISTPRSSTVSSSTNVPSTEFSSTGVTSTNKPSTSIPSTLASSTIPSTSSSSSVPSTNSPSTVSLSTNTPQSTVVSSTFSLPPTTSTSNTPVPSAPSTVLSTTQYISTVPTTTAYLPTSPNPNQCFYQSNVAVAFELSDPSSTIDTKIQNFIQNKLFANQAVYRLSKPNLGGTQLALVPYPTVSASLMNYGYAGDVSKISSVLKAMDQLSTGGDPDISQSFTTISSLSRNGQPGFVILIGYSDAFVSQSIQSANNLKSLGFNIYTISYNTASNFSPLQSQSGYGATITSDADEDTISNNLANLLNSTYCNQLPTTALPPITTTVNSNPSTGSPSSTIQASTSQSTINPSTGVGSSTAVTSSNPSTASSSTIQSSTSQSTINPSTGVATSTSTPSTNNPSTGVPSSNAPSTSLPSTSVSSTNVPSSTLQTTNGPTTSTFNPSTISSSTSNPSTTVSYTTTTPQCVCECSSTAPFTQSTVSQFVSSSIAPTTTAPGTTAASTTNQPITSAPSSSIASTVAQTTAAQSTIISSTNNPITSAPSTANPSTNQPTTADPCTCAGDWVYSGDLAIAYQFTSNDPNYQTTANFLNQTIFGPSVIQNYDLQGYTQAELVPYPKDTNIPYQPYGSIASEAAIGNYLSIYQELSSHLTDAKISDALSQILNNPGKSSASSIIIVGSDASDLPNAQPIADQLKAKNYKIITVSSGVAAQTLQSLASPGASFAITDGDNSDVANNIANILVNLNPACNKNGKTISPTTRCTPTVGPSSSAPNTMTPSTLAPITTAPSSSIASTVASTTAAQSTIIPTTNNPITSSSSSGSTVAQTTAAQSTIISSTIKPTTTAPSTVIPSTNQPTTADPCNCAGDWVYSGDLAIAYQLTSNDPNYQTTANFLNQTIFGPSVIQNYDLQSYTQAELVPYPKDTNIPYQPYGSIASEAAIGNYLSIYQELSSHLTDAKISDALSQILNNPGKSSVSSIIIVGSDASDLPNAQPIADQLKAKNYKIITVSSGVAAQTLQSLASPGASFAITDGDNSAVANSIANILVNLSPACNKNGKTISPSTRCTPTVGPSSSATNTITPSTLAPITSAASTSSIASSIASTASQTTTVSAQSTANTASSIVTSASSGSSISSTSVSTTISGTTQPASTIIASSTTLGVVTSAVSQSTNTATSTVLPATSTNNPTTSLPPQACTSAFVGDIAVAFENTQINRSVTDFLAENLFNNQVYSFSDVTRVINVPYPDTSSYGTLVQHWGDIKSLASYQQNINDFVELVTLKTAPTINEALQYILTSRPNNGVSNKILIIAGTNDTGVDAATTSLSSLKSNGYNVVSIAINNPTSRFNTMSNNFFSVDDGNKNAIVQQIANLICSLGQVGTTINPGTVSSTIQPSGSPTTVIPGSSTVASGSSTVQPSGSPTTVIPGSTTVQPSGSPTTAISGSSTVASGSSTIQPSGSPSTVIPGSSTVQTSASSTVQTSGSPSTVIPGSSTIQPSGSPTTVNPGSSTVASGSSTVQPSGSPATVIPGSSTVQTSGSPSTAIPGSSTSASGSSTVMPSGSPSTVNPGSSTSIPGSSTVMPSGSPTTVIPGSSTIQASGSPSTVIPGSSTVATGSSTVMPSGSPTTVIPGSSTVQSSGSPSTAIPGSSTVQPTGSPTTAISGSSTVASGSSTAQPSGSPSTVIPGSSTVQTTVVSGSSTAAPGSTTVISSSSSAYSTVSSPVNECGDTPFLGNIAVAYELNDDSQDISNFLGTILFSVSNIYQFGQDTKVINVPYPGTSNYTISNWNDITSLDSYKSNIDTLQSAANKTDALIRVVDALEYIDTNRTPEPEDTGDNVLIIVGTQDDVFTTSTNSALAKLRAKDFIVITISLNNPNSNLKNYADEPDYYFATDKTNQRSTAVQISNILCKL